MQNIVDNETIKAEIEGGISQVDETLIVDDFNSIFDKTTRKLTIDFSVKNENDEIIEINSELG